MRPPTAVAAFMVKDALRRSLQGSDAAVASLVRLLIIDEVHLLNDERGPVIETLVARTQRQVLTTLAASTHAPCGPHLPVA